ncbi:hypothetical protein Syun_009927 [Stephania yunnanensis]|uniref:Uncharacterized protein n=1 Tax=Stephania yunnanensis TaxID=152371 RepID=A0AAP0KFF8_9MAGN
MGKRLKQGFGFGRIDGCLKRGFGFGQSRLCRFWGFVLIVLLRLVPRSHSRAGLAALGASRRSFVASKAEEVKMVKEVMGAYGYNIERILMVDIIPDQSVRKAINEINAGFKFGCAAAVSDRFALLLTSSLQGRRISKTDTFETPPTVNELYLHLYTVNHDRVTFIDTRSEQFYLTQTTPDQLVDDEAVYYKVASECPKGRVYGLGSLGRKIRRYADPDASTSHVLAQ